MAFQYGRVAEIADGRGIGAALEKRPWEFMPRASLTATVFSGAGLYIFF
jgi:hypothetical protein